MLQRSDANVNELGDNLAIDDVARAKSVYVEPVLQIYGTIQELTAASNGDFFDGQEPVPGIKYYSGGSTF